ncbi:Glycine--tRNA ligase beta subunit [Serratia fonticola]|uniref:Glycine--tRNA ligase beta subunit n=1 Tax=Serratia fonticola TaxID=47917 RepID=A0A4U9WHG1_SERFO|nr:Glycine--tRNA ligase beta subunit [Serratia fonticola]
MAIADKMDTLAGIFGIGNIQKAIRPVRAAPCCAGVLRIIVEKNLRWTLQTLTEEAVRLYGDS